MIAANKYGQASDDDIKLELTPEEMEIAEKIKVTIQLTSNIFQFHLLPIKI